MSVSAANFWFNVSNIVLLFGALIVAIGTYGVYKTGSIKEKFADERISFNESETKRAQATSATANENTEVVRRSNLILQTDLEREKSARIKLETKLAPRRLTTTQSQAVRDAIKPFAGQKIVVTVPLGDSEAQTYAADFVKVLRDAGWNPGENSGISQAAFLSAPHGVILSIAQVDAQMPPPAAARLGEALKTLGLLTHGDADPNTTTGSIALVIGSKPS